MNSVVLLVLFVSTSFAFKVKLCKSGTCRTDENCCQVQVDGKLRPLCFGQGDKRLLESSNLDATTAPCGDDSTLKCQNGGTCLRVTIGQYHKDICICPSLSSGDLCENWGMQIGTTLTNFSQASTLVTVDKANTKSFLSDGGSEAGNGFNAAMFNIDGGNVHFNREFYLPVSQATSITYNDVTDDLAISLNRGNGQSIIFVNMPNYEKRDLRWIHTSAGIVSIATDNFGNTYGISTSTPYYDARVHVFNSHGDKISDIPLQNAYLYGSSILTICPASKILAIASGNTGYFYEISYLNSTITLAPTKQYVFGEFTGEVDGIAIDEFGNVLVAGPTYHGIDEVGVYKYSPSTNSWLQNMIFVDSSYTNHFWVSGFWVHLGLIYVVGCSDNVFINIYGVKYVETNSTFTTIVPDQSTAHTHTDVTSSMTTSLGPRETTTMQRNYTIPAQLTTTATKASTSTQEPCLNNPCMNNATCSYDVVYGVTCTCTSLCHGVLCETCSTPDACKTNMCNSGSTCQTMDSSTYMCICAPGYTGKYCYQTD